VAAVQLGREAQNRKTTKSLKLFADLLVNNHYEQLNSTVSVKSSIRDQTQRIP
jgi:hypothetical protein